MKRLLCTLALCFLASATNASAKGCKVKETDDGVLESKMQVVSRATAYGMGIRFLSSDDGLFLQVTYNRAQKYSENVVIDAETPITLQLEGEHQLILIPVDRSSAKRNYLLGTHFLFNQKKIEPIYSLSQDDLNWLAKENLASINLKIKYDDELTENDFEVKEKWAKKLKSIAICMVPIAAPQDKSQL